MVKRTRWGTKDEKATIPFGKWYLHRVKSSIPRVMHSASVIDENRMILIGGANSPYDVELLNIKKGSSLIKLPNIPTERRNHSSVVLDNYLYVIGGEAVIGVERNRSVHRLDVSKIDDSSTTSPSSNTNLWVSDVIPDIDEGKEYAAAVVQDGYIYLMGGYYQNNRNNEVSLSSCVRYRPKKSILDSKNKKWEEIKSMDTGRYSHAAVTVGGKIYIMGGFNGGFLKSMEIYDPVTNKFEYGPPLPIPLLVMTAVTIGDNIIVNGGKTIGWKTNEKTFVYDIKQETWKSLDSPSLNTPRGNHASAVLQNNKIVICGGEDKDYNTLDSIEWIFMDEILYGKKRWERRKEFILLKCLVERGRASPPTTEEGMIGSERKRKRKSVKEDFQLSCSRYFIQKSSIDVFRSILKFL